LTKNIYKTRIANGQMEDSGFHTYEFIGYDLLIAQKSCHIRKAGTLKPS
jgi:hypothetical protein